MHHYLCRTPGMHRYCNYRSSIPCHASVRLMFCSIHTWYILHTNHVYNYIIWCIPRLILTKKVFYKLPLVERRNRYKIQDKEKYYYERKKWILFKQQEKQRLWWQLKACSTNEFQWQRNLYRLQRCVVGIWSLYCDQPLNNSNDENYFDALCTRGDTQYKRPYWDVPSTWVAKSGAVR